LCTRKLKAITLAGRDGWAIVAFLLKFFGVRNSIILAITITFLELESAVVKIVCGGVFSVTGNGYHSQRQPHWQQTVSRNRSLVISALHTAHDRIHMGSSPRAEMFLLLANEVPKNGGAFENAGGSGDWVQVPCLRQSGNGWRVQAWVICPIVWGNLLRGER
jgi:hypothetical protein